MRSLTLISVCLLLAIPCRARIITVDDDEAADFNNIQAAINDSNDGDTIIVADGTYTGNGNRDINFLGKAITVRSTDPNDPNIVAATIIDCNGTEANPHRGFTFNHGEEPNSVLAGLTITNGYGPNIPGVSYGSCGGAILCNDCSPTISHCNITGNSAGVYGGGVFCLWWDSRTIITNCTIAGNSAELGGGICYEFSYPVISHCTIADNSSYNSSRGYGGGGIRCLTYDPGGVPGLISNCTIKGNSAEGNGGGVFCDWKTDIIISNCTISGNSAGSGGGIFCWDFAINAMLKNCTITGNSADIGGGICCNGSSVHYTITNCILWDDTAGAGNEIAMYGGSSKSGYYHTAQYSVIQGGLAGVYNDYPFSSSWTWGPGNIDEDPCFVDPGFWDVNGVWIDGDYHLLSDSSCINAGDPNYIPEPNETDVDGDLRVIDGRVDIGADEFYNECFPPGHLDYAQWLDVGMPECWCYPRQCHGDADGLLGGSPKTGFYYCGPGDLNILVSAWLVKEPPFGPGIASIPNGICADFAHNLGGSHKSGFYRVGPVDLNILIACWLNFEPPYGPGIPPDCLP
jgi:hypothetical protein